MQPHSQPYFMTWGKHNPHKHHITRACQRSLLLGIHLNIHFQQNDLNDQSDLIKVSLLRVEIIDVIRNGTKKLRVRGAVGVRFKKKNSMKGRVTRLKLFPFPEVTAKYGHDA